LCLKTEEFRINEYLIKRGFAKKEFPQSVEEYRKVLKKHLAVRNGKLLREFKWTQYGSAIRKITIPLRRTPMINSARLAAP
jgi:hypothetical protein